MAAKLPPSGDSEEKGTEQDAGEEGGVDALIAAAEADAEAPTTEGRDRKALAAEVELNPQSLVGSYFHRVENGEMVWGGVIVGEVQAGAYLAQVLQGLEGHVTGRAQVIVQIDQMVVKDEGYEWRFYDSENAMREAFAEYLVSAERR
jgi:hypothetical protein